MPEVVTLGETMAVLYPHEPVTLDDAGSLALSIGGAESNIAIGLSRLGHSVRFISRVGNDPFGARIRSTLDNEGVDTSFLLTDPLAPTGVFFREWLPDGARRVYYYRAGSAASRFTPDDLHPEMFAGARIVHLTGITPALGSSCAEMVAAAMQMAHKAGALVSFDPNYRARLWSPDKAQATLLPLLEQTDILLMGHEDALAVLGVDDDEAALARGVELGAKIVIMKRAEQGACALAEDGRMIRVPAYPVSAVIDPVGAGDGFNAGFLAGQLRGYDIATSMQLGARIGAAAVMTLGDYVGYPRAEQLPEWNEHR